MTRDEFSQTMARMSAAIGKPMAASQAEVYFACLGDLPFDVFGLAIKRALLEHPITTLPTISEIRKLAVEIQFGAMPDVAQAFEAARKAIRRYGYYQQTEGMRTLTPAVARIVSSIGWQSWCDSDCEDAIRAHFFRLWEAQASDTRRDRLLPEDLRTAISNRTPLSGLIENVAKRFQLPEA